MSARVIAVWGSPRSGKTTFSCRMGTALASGSDERRGGKRTVIVVGPDLETPVLPMLFPRRHREELPSLGKLLSMPDCTREELLGSLTVPAKGGGAGDRLAYLGYGPCDHALRYPAPSARAVGKVWKQLTELADVLIADCPSDLRHPLALYAMKNAETVFRLLSCDLPSAVWEASHRERYAARPDDPEGALRELDWEKQIPVATNPDGSRCRPAEDFRQAVTAFRFSLPFRKEWQTALAEGGLPGLPVGARERQYWESVSGLGEVEAE